MRLLTLSIGLDYNLKIYLEPNIEFGLNDVFSEEGILSGQFKSRINTIGYKVGLHF